MTFMFRPAVRESVSLLIGLAGSSGSGKTFSALRIASGLSGGRPFAVIDTEAGRAAHYAPEDPSSPKPGEFAFQHGLLEPPFTPARYLEAIVAAEKAGYPVIVVDSMSHEHAGDGGLLDMQEAELQRMAGDDYGKRERSLMASWIKPKGSHKRMLSHLLQLRAHLILCFRAEAKVEMAKDKNGKTVVIPKPSLTGLDGWIPVCEKNLPYELTCSFLLLADKPGVPKPIKLPEKLKAFFPAGQVVTEEAGEGLAGWAAGAPNGQPAKPKPAPKAAEKAATKPATTPGGGPFITSAQARALHDTAQELLDYEFRGKRMTVTDRRDVFGGWLKTQGYVETDTKGNDRGSTKVIPQRELLDVRTAFTEYAQTVRDMAAGADPVEGSGDAG